MSDTPPQGPLTRLMLSSDDTPWNIAGRTPTDEEIAVAALLVLVRGEPLSKTKVVAALGIKNKAFFSEKKDPKGRRWAIACAVEKWHATVSGQPAPTALQQQVTARDTTIAEQRKRIAELEAALTARHDWIERVNDVLIAYLAEQAQDEANRRRAKRKPAPKTPRTDRADQPALRVVNDDTQP